MAAIRLPRPWDSPGKNTGVGCHFPLQSWKWKVKVNSLSRVWLLATPWTAAYQASPSMGFSRQEYWSGLPLPSLEWRWYCLKLENINLRNLRNLMLSFQMYMSFIWKWIPNSVGHIPLHVNDLCVPITLSNLSPTLHTRKPQVLRVSGGNMSPGSLPANFYSPSVLIHRNSSN